MDPLYPSTIPVPKKPWMSLMNRNHSNWWACWRLASRASKSSPLFPSPSYCMLETRRSAGTRDDWENMKKGYSLKTLRFPSTARSTRRPYSWAVVASSFRTAPGILIGEHLPSKLSSTLIRVRPYLGNATAKIRRQLIYVLTNSCRTLSPTFRMLLICSLGRSTLIITNSSST